MGILSVSSRRRPFTFYVYLLCVGLFSSIDLTSGSEMTLSTISKFALQIYKTLRTEEGEKNILISPVSLHVALSMTLHGTQGNTQKELLSTLGFSSLEEAEKLHTSLKSALTVSGPVVIHLGNSIYAQAGLNAEAKFLETIQKVYNGECSNVDFNKSEEASSTINNWVKKTTQGKIDQIVEAGELSPMTKMILVNAMYFKGPWLYEFEKENTFDAPFYVNSNQEITVNMMFLKKKFNAIDAKKFEFSALELPYKNKSFSMVILLPHKKDGLLALEEKLDAQFLENIFSHMNQTKVDLYLPRFKIEGSVKASKILQSMGVNDLFSMGKADLSGISSEGDLYVHEINHKAVVEVTEEGTEAAAVTSVQINKRSMEFSMEFRVDHPFLFLITEKSDNTILFVGAVHEPLEMKKAHDEL